jgi:hypothetical protein
MELVHARGNALPSGEVLGGESDAVRWFEAHGDSPV